MTEYINTIHYKDAVDEPTPLTSYCGLSNEEIYERGELMYSEVCYTDIYVFSQCPECAKHPRIQIETLDKAYL